MIIIANGHPIVVWTRVQFDVQILARATRRLQSDGLRMVAMILARFCSVVRQVIVRATNPVPAASSR